MIAYQELEPGEAPAPCRADQGIGPLSDADRAMHAPDRHIVAVEGGSLVGRCSCWWTDAPRRVDARIGVIGHYAAASHAAGTGLLARACRSLAAAGCTMAVGPMDGNTWRRYRFVTERGEAPPFFLEPDNPDEWVSHWTSAGFTPLATYSSAVNDDLTVEDARTEAAKDAFRSAGITIRRFDASQPEAELRRIYDLSVRAFGGNFLYTPIPEREFMAGNRALLPHIRPELVLMAERGTDLVGFMFAIPDVLQARRGESIDTLILKTMAVDDACQGIGLGGVLMDDVQREARALGFRRAIHALMHEQNRSRTLSDRYAHTIRRYTLFSQPLSRS